MDTCLTAHDPRGPQRKRRVETGLERDRDEQAQTLMNNSRYHTAGPCVLPHECAVISLSAFGETVGERDLPGWKPFRDTGAGKYGRVLCENLKEGGDGIYEHILV